MPNWCVNKLTVRGPEEALSNFIKCSFVYDNDYGENIFSFAGTVDPKHEREYPTRKKASKIGPTLGLNWTVWGVRDPYVSEEKIEEQSSNKFVMWFKTAWSPPIFWAENVLAKEMFDGLRVDLAYCEQGMDIYGSVSLTKRGRQKVEGNCSLGLNYNEDQDEYIIDWDSPFGEFIEKWGFTEYGG